MLRRRAVWCTTRVLETTTPGPFKVNRRFSRGVNLTASYTYSKSLDDTSGIRNQGNDLLNPQNSYCIPCEYGPSAFDVRNRCGRVGAV